ncbi:AMP-binding protein [Nocardia sp. 2]|uniref:AMP-binding protein n=1 Tax=Nocardia acididurans TaxID=2802282 RepID=A0ABS1M5L0_9NOCA|nr:AMP-binding protein [Nocardia acididurans]
MSLESVATASNWVELVALQADRYGDRTAYTFLDENGAEAGSLSYRELDRRARAIAHTLTRTLDRGDRALLLHPAGLDYIAAFFGCLYAGVIAVPLFTPGRNRAEQIDLIARDCDAGAVLATRDIIAAMDRLDAELAFARLPRIATDEIRPTGAAATEPARHAIAYLQYTSGSTAIPKGVVVEHAMAIQQCLEMTVSWGVDWDSVVVSWLPHFHDFGQITGTLLPVFYGGRAVLMAPSTFVKNPVRWLDAVSEYRGTHSGAPNFAFDLCVDKTTPQQRAALDLSSWRVLSNGAEPVRKATLDRFEATFRPCGLPELSLTPGYGLAENTLKVTCGNTEKRYLEDRFDRAALGGGTAVPTVAADGIDLVGLGYPVLDTEMAVVATESGLRLTEGEVGEIWVRGPCVAPGYWNRPEDTARTFGNRITDEEGADWLRTGDLGFRYNGELFLCGRVKNLMIVNGVNYYLEDIEATAVDAGAGLRAGGVLAFSVDDAGAESLVLVAEYRTVDLLEPDRLAGSVHDAVARRHGVGPATVVLIEPGTIPRTTSGKLRRQQCRSDFLSGRLSAAHHWTSTVTKTNTTAAETHSTPLPAMGEMVRQAVLAQIHEWAAENRGGAAPQLDPDRTLAEQGFGSVDQIELHERLESWAGRRFAPELIWDAVSVADMVRVLAKVLGGAAQEGSTR